MIEKQQRPLIDRPRYVSKPLTNLKPSTVTKTERSSKSSRVIDSTGSNKKNINKQLLNKQRLNKSNKKVIDQQTRQPVSGSVNNIDETIKAVSPTPKNLVTPPIKPKVSEEEKNNDSGIFKQIKDKFVVKPKDK